MKRRHRDGLESCVILTAERWWRRLKGIFGMSVETKLSEIIATQALHTSLLHGLADAVVALSGAAGRQSADLQAALADLNQIILILGSEDAITGIRVVPGPITPRRTSMVTARIVKRGATQTAGGATKKLKAGDPPPTEILFFDNGDQPITIMGTNTAGDTLDISAVATLDPAPTSSDTTKLTVDAPAGMSFAQHAVNPGAKAGDKVTVTGGVKWNDPNAGIGPFTYTINDTMQAGPANNVVPVPGQITFH